MNDAELNEALRLAVLKHDVVQVHALLARGASASAPASDDGSTALHYATLDRRIDVATMLLASATVNVNAQDVHGHTALHHAAGVAGMPNGGEMLCMLLNAGADTSRKDRLGETPLDAARRYERRGAAPVSYLFDVN